MVIAFHINSLLLFWHFAKLFQGLLEGFIVTAIFEGIDDVEEMLVANQREILSRLLALEIL